MLGVLQGLCQKANLNRHLRKKQYIPSWWLWNLFRCSDSWMVWNETICKKKLNGRRDLDSKLSVISHWWGSFPNNPYESRIWYNYVLILNVACSANDCIKWKENTTTVYIQYVTTFLLPDNEIISIDTDITTYNKMNGSPTWRRMSVNLINLIKNNAFIIYELGCDQNDVPINWSCWHLKFCSIKTLCNRFSAIL